MSQEAPEELEAGPPQWIRFFFWLCAPWAVGAVGVSNAYRFHEFYWFLVVPLAVLGTAVFSGWKLSVLIVSDDLQDRPKVAAALKVFITLFWTTLVLACLVMVYGNAMSGM